MQDTKDIGNLLEEMVSENGRALTVKNLMTKCKIPQDHVINAIDFFEKRGEKIKYATILIDAAELAKKAGMEEKAKQLYDKAIKMEQRKGNTNYAARIAKKAGSTEKTKELFLKDSEEKEKKEDYHGAAESAEEAGMQEKATQLYVKAINNYEAGDYGFRDEYILRIIDEITKKAGMEDQKQNLYEKTIESYKKRWNTIPGRGYGDAARFAKEAGMPNLAEELSLEAIEKYLEDDNYLKAIDLAEEICGIKTLENKVKKKIIEEIQKYRGNKDAARFAKEAGMPNLAKDLYLESMKGFESNGWFKSAAESAEEAGMPNKAKIYRELIKIVGKDNIS